MENLGKFLACVLALAVALCPLWLYLIVQHFLSPTGFWQHLIVAGIGVWVLGGAQIFLLFAWFLFAYFFWLADL